MNLRELLALIIKSSREDWNFIAGTSFHSQFGIEGPPPALHAYSHHSLAVYVPDVAISMEWGIEWRENYQAAWVEKFPDPHATAVYLDVFFNHALVHRVPFVSVDGGNVKLPLPNNDHNLKVEQGACDLIKIIDRMGKAPRPDFHAYETELRIAGFTVVNEEWPKFIN
jgi:hypothetical protein